MSKETFKTWLGKLRNPYNETLPDIRRVNIWPEIIKTKAEIPEDFKNILDKTALLDSPAFPYMIYIPDYHWEKSDSGFQFVNLKSILVVLGEDRIHIFKKSESEAVLTISKFNDIYYIERGCILLFSWIKIYGNNGESLPSIEFNTTVEVYFDPIMEKLRSHYNDSVNLVTGTDPKPFDHQKDISIKMWNCAYDAIRSFLPGHNIIDGVYQSRILRVREKK